MSLAKAIKFRFLAAQLTQTETKLFVHKLDSNIIIQALFNQISNTPINQQSEADNINNIVSNIILSRKKKPKPLPTQNIKLDQLPKRLIGEISSFLYQYDNFNFGKTNRFVYLGCNSPNLLQKLDLIDLQNDLNYSSINLGLYPSVKDLKLDLYKFKELLPVINGLSVMSDLQSIEVNGDTAKEKDLDSFLEFNGINFDNITKLKCSEYNTCNCYFPAAKFMKLLTKFPNVQYLDFHEVYISLNANKIKDLYPNLKGLGLYDGYQDVNRSLIDIFGKNLDFLWFSRSVDGDLNLQNTDFGKLQEIQSWYPIIESIENILLTANNLKKVYICCQYDQPIETKTKKIITKLITTCKLLEYIEFEVHHPFCGEFIEQVLQGIENGLIETKKWKRHQMKIRFKVACDEKFNHNYFVSKIAKIIHWLDYSDINDFMLILSLYFSNSIRILINKNILLESLKSKCSSKTKNVKISILDECVVITNTNCKINGLVESWKMWDQRM